MSLKPHGDTLINKQLTSSEVENFRKRCGSQTPLVLDAVAEADLEMLSIGGYSPLTGFMTNVDRAGVAKEMRLQNGVMWPIPITLGIQEEHTQKLKPGSWVELVNENGAKRGVLEVTEVYSRDVNEEAQLVFGTTSSEHPGVAEMARRGPYCVAGPVWAYPNSQTPEFAKNRWAPTEARAYFAEKNWKKIVGFQTRNPVHRAHEYIIKCALEICDGLLLHPIVGFTKSDDIPAVVRMRCYEALIASSFPADRVLLSVLPAPMRYAGPREAVLHALVRKNYGCTHFIVGRDHAGVGNYYGTYDAQKIFERFSSAELGIQPLMFENSFFCRTCGQMGTSKTCPHDTSHHVSLSGTKVRELLKKGERPPPEFSRAQVADILIEWARA